MVLQLHNHILELRSFFVILVLKRLDPDLVHMLVLHLDLFKLRSIETVSILEFGSTKFNLKVACIVFCLTSLSLLLQEKVTELACLITVAVHKLFDQLLIASVHRVNICLLLVAKPFTLSVKCFLNSILDVFIESFDLCV